MPTPATATPKHRADGKAADTPRIKPGRHQSDNIGVTR